MTLNHNFGCFSGVGSGIAGNVIGLGAVVCRLVRWENCAKPVLYAGAVI